MFLAFLISIVAALVLKLACERADRVSELIVKTLVRFLPKPEREERELQWLGDMDGVNGEAWKIVTALGLVRMVVFLRLDSRYLDSGRVLTLPFALLGLVGFLPSFVLCTLLIRLDGPGSVLFSQRRLGKGGKHFKVYKLRTMAVDAPDRLRELLKTDPKAAEEWQKYQKLSNDPRITSFGRFLRKSSIDELPQLWNLLRGDMNLVGPRPLTDEQVKRLGDEANFYEQVRPGIVCTYNMHGGKLLTMEERLAADKKYVEERSLLLDVKIVFGVFTGFFSKPTR